MCSGRLSRCPYPPQERVVRPAGHLFFDGDRVQTPSSASSCGICPSRLGYRPGESGSCGAWVYSTGCVACSASEIPKRQASREPVTPSSDPVSVDPSGIARPGWFPCDTARQSESGAIRRRLAGDPTDSPAPACAAAGSISVSIRMPAGWSASLFRPAPRRAGRPGQVA